MNVSYQRGLLTTTTSSVSQQLLHVFEQNLAEPREQIRLVNHTSTTSTTATALHSTLNPPRTRPPPINADVQNRPMIVPFDFNEQREQLQQREHIALMLNTMLTSLFFRLSILVVHKKEDYDEMGKRRGNSKLGMIDTGPDSTGLAVARIETEPGADTTKTRQKAMEEVIKLLDKCGFEAVVTGQGAKQFVWIAKGETDCKIVASLKTETLNAGSSLEINILPELIGMLQD